MDRRGDALRAEDSMSQTQIIRIKVKSADEFDKLRRAFGDEFSDQFLKYGDLELNVSDDGTFEGRFVRR